MLWYAVNLCNFSLEFTLFFTYAVPKFQFHRPAPLVNYVTLVDGDSEMEGRVEVCRGGVWGAVYDSTGWNFNDAQVTCRQLGYPSECELVCTGRNRYHRKSIVGMQSMCIQIVPNIC